MKKARMTNPCFRLLFFSIKDYGEIVTTIAKTPVNITLKQSRNTVLT